MKKIIAAPARSTVLHPTCLHKKEFIEAFCQQKKVHPAALLVIGPQSSQYNFLSIYSLALSCQS